MVEFFKKYSGVIISVAVSLLMCTGFIFLENSLNTKVPLPAIRLICDGTFVTAVLFVSFGGLTFIAYHGGFDAFNYAFIKLKDMILHPRRMDRSDNDTYYDYVKSKRDKKKKPYLHLFIIGLIYLVVSVILVFFTPDIPIEDLIK